MEFILKALAQAPLVAVLVYMYFQARKDYVAEIKRLQERVHEKDEQLGEFTRAFDKLSLSLELIKDRLRR